MRSLSGSASDTARLLMPVTQFTVTARNAVFPFGPESKRLLRNELQSSKLQRPIGPKRGGGGGGPASAMGPASIEGPPPVPPTPPVPPAPPMPPSTLMATMGSVLGTGVAEAPS